MTKARRRQTPEEIKAERAAKVATYCEKHGVKESDLTPKDKTMIEHGFKA